MPCNRSLFFAAHDWFVHDGIDLAFNERRKVLGLIDTSYPVGQFHFPAKEEAMRVTCRSLYSSRFVGALLAMSAIALMMACGEVSKNPVAPSATSSSVSAVSPGTPTGSTAQAKVDICHRTNGTDAFVAISIAASALDAHFAHGDARVGDPAPAEPGMKFGADCTLVAAGPARITFSDLLVQWAPVSTYEEAGFNVVTTIGSWQARIDYGHPEPFIQFRAVSDLGTTGQIRVTAVDGNAFRFASVDLYSSVTVIPYVFAGLRNSVTVFSVEGLVPNTFGNFATVANSQTDIIDTLLITLTNTPPLCVGCSGNPMGLDNVVLIR